MNGDGRLDIVSGCYSARQQDMMAPVWVLYRTEAGDFAEAVALKNDADKHVVASEDPSSTRTDRICTEPFAYDWDDDGDLDLVIGNFTGSFLLAINVGTSSAPAFEGEPEFLTNRAGERLKLKGNHGAPCLVDWDGDGDVDLISGSGMGGVQIAENVPAEDGTPRFSDFRVLIEAPVARSYRGICPADTPITPSTSWRVCVADYDADGKLDVIVGDCLRRDHPKRGLTVAEANAKQAEWSARSREIGDEVVELKNQADRETDETAKAELTAKIKDLDQARRDHYQTRSEFIEPFHTGHVWVYVQK